MDVREALQAQGFTVTGNPERLQWVQHPWDADGFCRVDVRLDGVTVDVLSWHAMNNHRACMGWLEESLRKAAVLGGIVAPPN